MIQWIGAGVFRRRNHSTPLLAAANYAEAALSNSAQFSTLSSSPAAAMVSSR
jgi:hypothetical protein